jgi:hypothetical protein
MQVGPEKQSIRGMIRVRPQVRYDVASLKDLYGLTSRDRALVFVNPQELPSETRLATALEDLAGNALSGILQVNRPEFPVWSILRFALYQILDQLRSVANSFDHETQPPQNVA